ncbi:hypothetical protein [Rhodococcus sp. ACPA1]|uniref:hypothetical protein n=1 Tax=Rhodococcus sp. ACPA1 TaxID=2028572 RepID=UPI000BB12B1A|nr:hypothetical protein [Rhodococcus sp. ACPA1]PBC51447.1 hypothetical protein CJ177_33600 [Rhodococcus sp. ACPA1]
MVSMDILGGHTSAPQCIDLVVEVLACAGDPRVADQHVSANTSIWFFDIVSRHGLSTLLIQ